MRIIICLLLITTFTLIRANYVEDIRKIVDSFGKLTAESSDLAATIRLISKTSAALIKTFSAVASLVMTAVTVFIKSESDEFRALKNLHNLVKHKFNDIERIVELQKHEHGLNFTLMQYLQVVELSIDTIEGPFKWITDPLGDRNASKETFVRECSTGNTPREALFFLDRVVNKNCLIPTKREVKKHAKLRTFFRGLEPIAAIKRIYKHYKTRVFEIYGALNCCKRCQLLNHLQSSVLKGNITTADDVILGLKQTIEQFEEHAESGCLLDALVEGKKWHRAEIYSAINVIRLHVLKLALIQSACINVTNNGNPIQIKRDFEELTEKTTGIITRMAQWLPAKLEKSWPEITAENAKDTIVSDITHEAFNSTANLTAKNILMESDLTGTQRFVHSVIVTEGTYDNIQWIFVPNCVPPKTNRCLAVKGYHGVNVLIFRYHLGERRRMNRANTWLKYASTSIKRSIEKYSSQNEYLPWMFEQLKRTTPGMIDPEHFYNFVLIYNQNIWAEDTTTPTGVAFVEVDTVEPIQFVEFYFHSPVPFFVNYRYRLFFIL